MGFELLSLACLVGDLREALLLFPWEEERSDDALAGDMMVESDRNG